jgi:hypothetical protein
MLELLYEKQEDIPAEYAALYTEKEGKFVLTGVKGLKTQADMDRVNEGARKEREDHKKTKDRLAQWGDLDPTEVLPKLESIPELEAAAAAAGDKVDTKKFEEAVEGRVKIEVGKVQRDLTKTKEELAAAAAERDTLKVTLTNTQIGTALRQAAVTNKVADTAVEDVVVLGLGQFQLNDEGKVVHKELGVEPSDWLVDQKDKRPHLWPTSVGANGRGGNGQNFPTNPWSREHWNITEQGKIIDTKGAEHADRMAKAAGVENRMAPRPAAKAA